MKDVSKNYIDQYKLLFYLSWIIIYFIFPAWRFPQILLPISKELIAPPISPVYILLIYFLLAACMLNLFLKNFIVDKPLFIYSNNLSVFIRNNVWVVVICCIAAGLHIFTYSPLLSLTGKYSLWIYNFLNLNWQKLFDFPFQYPLWLFILLLLLMVKQKRVACFISNTFLAGYFAFKSNYLTKFLFLAILIGIFLLYSRFLPYYTWREHLLITSGYPPLGTLMYSLIYALFGTGYVFLAPTIVQMTFYILSGIFLYRTINLFFEKETALLGSSIYLFSPLVFTYATLGWLASGTIFFIIIVSYYFLKFLRDAENKDLLLTAYFISIGSLYKRVIIWMFLICCVYLVVMKIKQKEVNLISHIKILSLSVISFLPWHFIGSRGMKAFVWSHFTTLDSLFQGLLMIPTQLSWPIFILFILSIIFVLVKKKDHLTVFFGFVFIVYYLLFTVVEQKTVHRYSMSYYPTISVFLSLFISNVLQKIKWRYAYQLTFSVLIIYLAILCVIPRSSTDLISFKYKDFENQHWPDDKAVEWILNETRNDEKALALIWVAPYKALRNKVYPYNVIEAAKLFPQGDFEAFRQNLKDLCREFKISYIISPGGNAASMHPYNASFLERDIRRFLKEDKYDDFILAARFSISDNHIDIFKVKHKFIEEP